LEVVSLGAEVWDEAGRRCSSGQEESGEEKVTLRGEHNASIAFWTRQVMPQHIRHLKHSHRFAPGDKDNAEAKNPGRHYTA
jgi:hypothetical protein